MSIFGDLSAGFKKFLSLAWGIHIVTGTPVLHSIGLEGGGGTGKEVVILSALGDGAYNEAGEGAWGVSMIVGGGTPETGSIEFEALWFMTEPSSGAVRSFIESSPSGCPISDFLAARAQSVQVITQDDEWFEFQPRDFGSDFQVDMFVCISPMDDYQPIHTWNSSGACSQANGGWHHWQTVILSPSGFEYHQWGLFFTDSGGWCSVFDPAYTGPRPQFQYDSTTVIRFTKRDGELVLSVPAGAPDFTTPSGVWTVVGSKAEYTYSKSLSQTNDFVGHAATTGPLFNQPLVPAAPSNAPVRLVVLTSGAVGVDPANQPGLHQAVFSTQGGGSGEIIQTGAVKAVLYAGERLLSNWHYHPGTISRGALDPIQGEDSYFPGRGTFSATPYISVLLPEGVAEDADASKLAIILETSCVADYDETGTLISIEYSPNPSRVKADMLKRRGKLHRLNWASYIHSRDFYNGLLNWSTTNVTNTYSIFSGVPIYDSAGNISITALTGAASKPNATDANDNHGTTQDRILQGTDGWYEVVVNAAFPTGTGGGSIHLIDSSGKGWFGISWGNGHIGILANGVGIDDKTIPYDFPAVSPVTFRLESDNGFFLLKQDGNLLNIPQGPAPVPVDKDLFGRISLYGSAATISSSNFSGRRTSSSTQNVVQVKRFEAHPAFTGPVDIGTALDWVDLMTCSETQESGKEIIFVTPEPRRDFLTAIGKDPEPFVFDEDINVVSIKIWEKDVRERPNRLWGTFRNLDLEFLDEDTVFDLRDELFQEVGRPIDPGAENLGSMSASQAWRVIKYRMRIKSDNYRLCDLEGMHDSVGLVAVDVVTVLTTKLNVSIDGGYNAGVTTINLIAGQAALFRLPPTPFFATWWNFTDHPEAREDPNREVIQVTAVVGDTLTINSSTFSHNIAGKEYLLGRIPKDFIIITAAREGTEVSPLNRTFSMQEYYPDDYRDDDHQPQQEPVGTPPPSPFSCPPTPVMELSQQSTEGVTKVLGTIHFGIFPFTQFVKIYVTKEGQAEIYTGQDISPAAGTTTGQFEYIPDSLGLYTFRAEVWGQSACGSTSVPIELGGFIVNPTNDEILINSTTGEMLIPR